VRHALGPAWGAHNSPPESRFLSWLSRDLLLRAWEGMREGYRERRKKEREEKKTREGDGKGEERMRGNRESSVPRHFSRSTAAPAVVVIIGEVVKRRTTAQYARKWIPDRMQTSGRQPEKLAMQIGKDAVCGRAGDRPVSRNRLSPKCIPRII